MAGRDPHGPAGLDRDKVVANAEAIEGISTINHAAIMKDRAWIVGENGYLGVPERKDKKWQPFNARLVAAKKHA